MDNRRLFAALLRESSDPRAQPILDVLDAITANSEAAKLISTYIAPLTTPDNPSALVGGIAYPQCYIVPSAVRDSSSDNDEGGQLHCRLSIKKPAVQTFPPVIKACIRSRYGPAGCIISTDLSQIELRVAGVLSGDPFYVNEYAKPKPDLHGNMAVAAMGPDVRNDPHWKSGDRRHDPRQWGKTLNFWNLYRGGVLQGQRTLLKFTGRLFPVEFFRSVIAARPVLTPRLWDWQESILTTVERTGILTLPITGHSRYFTGYRRHTTRSTDDDDAPNKSLLNEILNFPVQATAALTAHRIMHTVLRRVPPNARVHPILHVHDAIYFDIHRSERTRLIETVDAAVAYVATHDYWARLIEITGHSIPLVHELTDATGHVPA